MISSLGSGSMYRSIYHCRQNFSAPKHDVLGTRALYYENKVYHSTVRVCVWCLVSYELLVGAGAGAAKRTDLIGGPRGK